jgi:4-hydroxyphenylacetate 3-monooxygenase
VRMTGDEYRESIRDGRTVLLDGERVTDVPNHPAFRHAVDLRARIYDMAHEDRYAAVMTYEDAGGTHAITNLGPRSKDDLRQKRDWVRLVMRDAGGLALRMGDETVGALWSLLDGREMLDAVDSRFGENIAAQVERVRIEDRFVVSANTDPKGDRSLPPQEQDPDMLLHVVGETDAGIVVRGAKYETGAAYAHEAFVKPTIANWGNETLSDYALGFLCPMNLSGLKHICRSPLSRGLDPLDYPISARFDEVDSLIVFDNVTIPWEYVFFFRHTKAAAFVRAMLHRYTGFPFVERMIHLADMLIGAASFNARQTGLDKNPAVREKLARMIVYREGINAFQTASVELAEESTAGYMMPHQSTFYAGRAMACAELPAMMHLTRELVGGQICLTPDHRSFDEGESAGWLKKYYTVNERWGAEDRRRLLAFARDLVNSSHAGHRISYHLFAQAPPYAHLNALYQTFDWEAPLDFVKKAAGLSDRVMS